MKGKDNYILSYAALMIKDEIVKKYNQLSKRLSIHQENREGINGEIKRILREFTQNSINPAIYCNGKHTKMLMSDFMFELKRVKYIVDKDVNKNLLEGFIIINDSSIEECGVDAIIISSYRFADEIEDQLKKEHPNVNVLNIYRELKKRGYFLGVEYYNLGHPYGTYKRINDYILFLEQNIGDIETIIELVKELVKIKDFELAFFYASQLQRLDNSDEKQYSMICNIISEINVLMEKALKQIDENNVLMLCVDGLRRKDVSYEYMPKTRKTIDEKGFWLDNAYSYSTSTFESLIPVYSENYDLQTKYYEKNAIEEGECRFVCEAVKQNRNIYFRTDMDRIVSSEKIRYSGCFETATEKVWNFIMDALDEKNGLFYVHILYESHFSFPSPLLQSPIIAEGTSILFDFLPKNGGKIRTDYIQQHRLSRKYLDGIISKLLSNLSCQIVMYADHGNLLLSQTAKISDLSSEELLCGEELTAIPITIFSKELGHGTSSNLVSLSCLNDIIVSLLRRDTIEIPCNEFVKLARSQIYNPDFRYLYTVIEKERFLQAFEAYIFNDGATLFMLEDGTAILKFKDCEDCDNKLVIEKYRKKIDGKVGGDQL